MEREYEYGYSSNVGVKERETPASSKTISTDEGLQEAKERMQKNLDRLLHYEEYENGQAVENVATIEKEVENKSDYQDEDIKPTSTTLQFGDGTREDIMQELNQSKTSEKRKLSAKGKLAIVLYSLAVTVIFALIVLNSGILSSLANVNESKALELNELYSTYSQKVETIEEISNDAHVSEMAEEEFGMIIK